jgi:hypothetical protein
MTHSRPGGACRRSKIVILGITLLVSWNGTAVAQTAPLKYCRSTPSTEKHARLFQRWIDEVWHQGRVDLVPELVGVQYVRHEGTSTRVVTRAEYAAEIEVTRARLPDARFIIHDCDVVGDRIWTRWTMTAKSAQSGELVRRMAIQVYRIADINLVETWMLVLPTDGAWQ